MSRLKAPDGIREEHAEHRRDWKHHASPLGLAIFSVVMLVALLGFFGHERTQTLAENGVEVSWHGPAVIRNGEFLEIRLDVRPEDQIDELVIGVEASLWRDMTINTIIPAPAEEASQDGEFAFTFGEVAAGAEFNLKVDAQINPDLFGGTRGAVRVYDGEELLVELPISMEVRP